MVTFSPQTHQACGAGGPVPLSAASSTHPCPTSIFAARAPFRRGAARITQASTTRAAMSAAGEEATIVGLTSVMRPDDYLIGTYRAAHGAQVGRREATLRAAPAAPRPRRRARARRRAAERHPAPARPREPRHHLGLPPRHRHRGDHRHGPRATRTDDVRQRWTPDLKDRRWERPGAPARPGPSRRPCPDPPHARASSAASVVRTSAETLAFNGRARLCWPADSSTHSARSVCREVSPAATAEGPPWRDPRLVLRRWVVGSLRLAGGGPSPPRGQPVRRSVQLARGERDRLARVGRDGAA